MPEALLDGLRPHTFPGVLPWARQGNCRGSSQLFFAPARERPERRAVRESRARGLCEACPVLRTCRDWARDNREYGFWGGESEEDRAAAGFRVAIPIGDVARYPRGEGRPVEPRDPRAA
jgi:WhiB family redox-sensing transcriptional regulator